MQLWRIAPSAGQRTLLSSGFAAADHGSRGTHHLEMGGLVAESAVVTPDSTLWDGDESERHEEVQGRARVLLVTLAPQLERGVALENMSELLAESGALNSDQTFSDFASL
jgi:hypothetical protein